jgi:lipid-binding SYLF domain-containing protein
VTRDCPVCLPGVSAEGTTIRRGDDENEQFNGHAIKAKEIVRGEPMVAPATGCHYVDVLEKAAPRNESKEAASAKK